MGGCCSVSIPCDQVVNQFSQWLCLKGSYIPNLSENLASLEKAMDVLKAKRDDVQTRVNREEFGGHQRRLAKVQVWLTSVLTIENEFNDLLKNSRGEIQMLCLCGFCSKNLKQSYKYGKRVIMMSKDVESLGSQGEFDVVTEKTPITEVQEIPFQPTIVGQETMLESVWNRLMDDEVGIVGLYGMGGVGKTTLLTQINNKLSKTSNRFDIVIWVVVSNGATIRKIQGDIARKLGLRVEEWDQKEETQKAMDIYNALRRHKFVLLLDDIWEKVDLKAVGVPYPSRENKSKVAFTTRSRDVCGRMGVQQPIKVNCLDSEKAWELFQKKVGVETLESHPNIPELARKVAEKCGGLPLALNVIGETMACKSTIQEWYHAIDVLTSCAADFPDIENDVLPILKYSYDNLRGEKVKSCFLYCSLFPEDYRIEKKRLIDYWICEGLIDENESREKAINRGYEILGTLVRACLLLENNRLILSTVSMHDVVREMALWITTDFGNNKDQCVVQAGMRLREVPKVKNWKNVKKMSLMENDIEKIIDSPDCPQLTTLFLHENRRLVNISGEFFRSLTRLLVLDLSWDNKLTELPEEISHLVSLRYLGLFNTKIKRLPIGLQELIHLDLGETSELENLHDISRLSSLRVLRLKSSKVMLDMNLMKDLELLEHLEYITIDIPLTFVEEHWSYDSRVWRCIQDVKIKNFQKKSVRKLVLPAVMTNLHQVNIANCGMQEIKIEKISWNKSLSSPCFSSLSFVWVGDCNGLKDLTWLLFAPNLTFLHVGSSKQVESIINKEKAASVLGKDGSCKIIPFQKLEVLYLFHLPELKSIYWTSLPFPSLQNLCIDYCENVRKLPLDSRSVAKIEEFTIKFSGNKKWIERIEWEDEDTKLRFLPSLV